jgi:hypothetical protein
MKTMSIRVERKFSEIESESVAAWLAQTLESGSPLADDPGAGEVTLRLSLDENQVRQLSQREGEKPAVALRRLIATRAPSLPVQTEVAAEKPEEKSALDAELLPPKSELPRRMQLIGEDVLPLVKLLAVGERALLRWQMGIPKGVHLPEDDAADRALADASATVVNSRAPAVFTRNGDVVKFSLVFIRHAWATYEIAEKYAREHAKEQAGRVTAAASVPAPSPVSGAPVRASVDVPVRVAVRSEPSPSPASAEIHASLDNFSDGAEDAYRMELDAARKKLVPASINPVNPSLDKL